MTRRSDIHRSRPYGGAVRPQSVVRSRSEEGWARQRAKCIRAETIGKRHDKIELRSHLFACHTVLLDNSAIVRKHHARASTASGYSELTWRSCGAVVRSNVACH